MTTTEKAANEGPLFKDLDPDDDWNNVTEIESLCMNCHEQGVTRLLLTRIPFFREIIISSFCCESCGYDNREIQPGGSLMEKGARHTLTVKCAKDFDREVVKSDSAMICIPSLDFEAPPAKKGEITTVEGIIDGIKEGLEAGQPIRRAMDAESAGKIDEFITRLVKLKDLDTPFTLVVDDPAGNSFVENPHAPQKDACLTTTHYTRTRQQDVDLGFAADEDEEEQEEKAEENTEPENLKDEVLTLPGNCSSCNSPCNMNMKIVDIPFFKEVVIMASVCDSCGYKDSEVKAGAGIEDLGTRVTLKITDPFDMHRDVLKSDMAGVRIPELELEMTEGTLGGKFTTLEGLIGNIKDQLVGNNPFLAGDSSQSDTRQKMHELGEKLDQIMTGKMLNIHFILDDPSGNSYLQNIYAPDPDPEMKIERYERSFDQNETMGLNDMKTENYTEDA